MGGGESASNDELNSLLESATTTWSAAVNGSQSAATYELATDTAVMAIGGWSSDPAPSLDEFIAYVTNHQVTYYISGGGMGGGAGGGAVSSTADGTTADGTAADGTANAGAAGGDSTSTASEIQAWVEANFTATTVGSSTVYDLSGYVA